MANEVKLNPAQQRAVDYPHNKPAIVTAAAGSGKTTLLVERVIRLLSDMSLDIPADALAVMTFTKNATKNMREKLNRALNEKINSLANAETSEEREQYDYLKKQLFALRRASISTIDAFCLRMIKDNAEMFDLPLNFTIADGAKKAAMQSQAMKAAMRDLYGSAFADEERDTMFFSFSFEDDNDLESAVLSTAEKLSSFTDPKRWIDNAKSAYKDIHSIETNFLPLLDNYLDLYVNSAELQCRKYSEESVYENLYNEVQDKLAVKETSALKTMNETVLPAIKEYIAFDEKRVAALSDDYKDYRKFAEENKFRSLEKLNALMLHLEENSAEPPVLYPKNGNNLEYKKLFNSISKGPENAVQKLLNVKISAEYEENALPTVQLAVNTFFRLLEIYIEYYDNEKITSGCIDFSDCERLLYDKLNENSGDNEFCRQLSQRFKCVIVDEFQDSNNIQAEIFRLIGGDNLFYVGDVKQSIYAFRGADPYIMAQLCDSPETPFEKLPLNTNYRSRKAVIDTVNAAFSGLMTPKFGGVDYADNNGLNLGLELPEPQNKEFYSSEICLVTVPKQELADGEKDKNMIMPQFVANKIKNLIDDPEFLVSDGKDENKQPKYRRANYSDFIVLLRGNSKIECYRKALSELGISSTAPKGSNFFDADEIKMAWNYLKIIDNPMLNEEMLKVLMSPIYRFSAEETAQLKLGILGLENIGDERLKVIASSYRRRSLYSCVCDCVSQTARLGKEKIDVTRKILPKLQRFWNDLKAFRYFMSSNSLDNLVRKIYEDTDLISVVAAFEDSAGRVANIRQLERMAADFESRGGDLGDFLRFLERAKENDSSGVEQAARAESSENAVRIMTFHGSKGLEAPVCIMSELQNSMNTSDYSGNLLISREHFLAMKHTDIKLRRKTKNAAYQALSRFIRDRQLGDELRLLYVAMTRAQEKLIMVSSIGKTNFGEFNKFINSEPIDPALHDVVYENSVPFNCVFKTLLQYAPIIEKDDKEFTLRGIDCKVAATDLAENSPSEENAANKSVSANDEPTVFAENISKLSALLKQTYSHLCDTKQQAKFTATELAHKKEPKPISLTKPNFANQNNAVSGVEKGNAYHHCMQNFPLDFMNAEMSGDEILKAVERAIADMVERRKITEEESKIIEDFRVAKFFTSPLGKRVLNAYSQNPDNVKREQSFYAEVKGGEVRQDYEGSVSVQGQIDMYFIEDGEIVVVDYKSDTLENLAKEQKNYEFQVEIYKNILGKLTGINVKEMYLYAFLADKEMKI